MKKKFDIVALGESLIDFVAEQGGADGKIAMNGSVGGAPANVLACAAKYGLKTAMISKIGADSFGNCIADTLSAAGICTNAMIKSGKQPTTLAMVTLDSTGDRSFSFYRHQTADVMLNLDEVNKSFLEDSAIFHFGSVSLTEEPVRTTTLKSAEIAKTSGALVSYDPNLRERLWKDLADAKKWILEGMKLADIAKLSEEELEFLTGEKEIVKGIEKINQEFQIQLLIITQGAKGCTCVYQDKTYQSAAFAVETVDTTAAGDTFWGTVLSCILNEKLDLKKMTEEQVCTVLKTANAAGSLATSKRGAIASMPTIEEVEYCMKNISQIP